MSIHRRLSRAAAITVAFIITTVALGPPANASGAGAGIMDGDVVYSGSPEAPMVAYPVLYFFGRLEVAGRTYDGGFYIAGMNAAHDGVPDGSCFGLDCISVTSGELYEGRDAGAVHGFDPNPGAVDGECRIKYDFSTGTGPFFLVEVVRETTINCTASVLGSAPTDFTISVTAHTDYVGHVVGAYTVS